MYEVDKGCQAQACRIYGWLAGRPPTFSLFPSWRRFRSVVPLLQSQPVCTTATNRPRDSWWKVLQMTEAYIHVYSFGCGCCCCCIAVVVVSKSLPDAWSTTHQSLRKCFAGLSWLTLTRHNVTAASYSSSFSCSSFCRIRQGESVRRIVFVRDVFAVPSPRPSSRHD